MFTSLVQNNPQFSAIVITAVILLALFGFWWTLIRSHNEEPKELEEALSVDDWILMGDDSLGVMHMGPVNAKFVSATDGKTVQVRLKHPFGGTHVSIRPDPDRPGKNMRTQFGTDLPFVGFEEP